MEAHTPVLPPTPPTLGFCRFCTFACRGAVLGPLPLLCPRLFSVACPGLHLRGGGGACRPHSKVRGTRRTDRQTHAAVVVYPPPPSGGSSLRPQTRLSALNGPQPFCNCHPTGVGIGTALSVFWFSSAGSHTHKPWTQARQWAMKAEGHMPPGIH